MTSPSEDNVDIDTVLRQEELKRSLAAQHKLEVSIRRNSRRKRPTLPLVVENREIQQTVRNFYRKLRKVNQHCIIFLIYLKSRRGSLPTVRVGLIKFIIKGNFNIKRRGEWE